MKMIKNFLKNPDDTKSAKEGYVELLKIFKSKTYKFSLYDDEQILNLFHEFLISRVFDNLTFKKFLVKAKNEEVTFYIKKMINNFLINEYYKKQKLISLEIIEHTHLKDERLLPEIYSEAALLTEVFKKNLNNREQMLLCRYLFPEKYNFLNNLKQNAYYKAVERLKSKLQGIFQKNNISEEATNIFLNKIYLSEICDKICNKL